MSKKDNEIKELKRRLDIATTINKLSAERELMYWQGKNEKRKFNWFYPMMAGAGVLAIIQTLISAISR
ncbi:hypothetical protein JCM19235_1611 [Vibrio maritimus]|uniref:Uncharacterized protein n=1 Tax=Vibrio maritimus TaxID=990268 RepID=A0A090S5J3_9VIBR|nr:hypothetical protein JCM19235_1611 [Vibrio maritimus]